MIIYQNVSELTQVVKTSLENNPELTFFKVNGEISNYKHHSSNHRYFTLKDKKSQISVVMFSTYANQITFEPKDGDFVSITGQISLYEPSGTYSIRALKLEKVGQGLLYEKYLKLKADLEKLGYFDQSLKKHLPKFPKAIGVVTSKTGAVLHDITQTLEMRYKLAPLYLYQASVQGGGSAQSIAAQIIKANEDNIVDVLIVGRGGGSIEDLWAFNEIAVIEAILKSKIPIITAIGHETDTTISDFVSDARAATPTQAAVLASPNMLDLMNDIKDLTKHLILSFKRSLDNKSIQILHLSQNLSHLSPLTKLTNDKSKVIQLEKLLTKNFEYVLVKTTSLVNILQKRIISPSEMLNKRKDSFKSFNQMNFINIKAIFNNKKNKFNEINYYLLPNYKDIIINKKQQFFELIQTLKNLNPLSKLDIGFGLISKDNVIVKSSKDIFIDDVIEIKLKDGNIEAKVINKKDGI